MPEVSLAGKVKDALFPQKRLDFYALVQAKKRKDSPHGKWEATGGLRPSLTGPPSVEGLRWAPKEQPPGDSTNEKRLGPFY